MHVCMDITKNKYELIDRKVKRKKTERTTVIAYEQRRANIHCTEMHFSENKKKRRNVVTRNTGSDTERARGKEKTKENTRGRGSLCFTNLTKYNTKQNTAEAGQRRMERQCQSYFAIGNTWSPAGLYFGCFFVVWRVL